MHDWESMSHVRWECKFHVVPKAWLESLDATRGASGILYTTWLDKYDLLGPFGDLVSLRK